MGCADQASDAAKKDMNIVYQKIYKIIKAREMPDITSKFKTAQKTGLHHVKIGVMFKGL